MKYVVAILCSAVLYANDVDSVDSMVKDIEDLRVEYNECKEKSNKFEKQVKVLKNTLLIKENTTENLSLKVKKPEKKLQKTESTVAFSENKLEKIEKVLPATFRLNTKAGIYDSVNGVKIATWDYKKLFTSYIQTENWVKVTGYFIQKKWKEPNRELWIKKENITKRLNK